MKLLALLGLLLATNPVEAGFISSNGMSLPIGLICRESNDSQIQVKLDQNSGQYRVRRVVISSRHRRSTTYLTYPLACRGSTRDDEPTIENHCKSLEAARPSTLEIKPWEDRILMLIESPLIQTGGQIALDFSSDQCWIELDQNIHPQ